MKKLIAAAGLGAALTVGSLTGAGAASADSGSFIYAANDQGWYDNNPGGVTRLGNGVCNLLNLGYSEVAAMNWVYSHTDYTVSIADAGQLVSMAEDYLC